MEQQIQEMLDRIYQATLLGSKDVLTSDEACMFLGVQPDTLIRWTKLRMIPHYKGTPKKNYFKKQDLVAFMTNDAKRVEARNY